MTKMMIVIPATMMAMAMVMSFPFIALEFLLVYLQQFLIWLETSESDDDRANYYNCDDDASDAYDTDAADDDAVDADDDANEAHE